MWGQHRAIGAGFASGGSSLMRRQKDGRRWRPAPRNMLAAVIGIPLCSLNAEPFELGSVGRPRVLQLGLSYILFAKAVKHATALESIFVRSSSRSSTRVVFLCWTSGREMALVGGDRPFGRHPSLVMMVRQKMSRGQGK